MPDFFRGRFFDPYDKNNKKDDHRNFILSLPLKQLENDIFNKLLPNIEKQ